MGKNYEGWDKEKVLTDPDDPSNYYIMVFTDGKPDYRVRLDRASEAEMRQAIIMREKALAKISDHAIGIGNQILFLSEAPLILDPFPKLGSVIKDKP